MAALSLMYVIYVNPFVPQLWNCLPVPLKAPSERRSYEVLPGLLDSVFVLPL